MPMIKRAIIAQSKSCLVLIFRHMVPPFEKGGQGGFDSKDQGQIPLNPPLLKGDFIRKEASSQPDASCETMGSIRDRRC